MNGVSLAVDEGQMVALVGESGCGKSVTAFSINRLLPCPPAVIKADELTLDGQNILELPERQMRNIRGSLVSMIFQEPMTSLNPVFTCGEQISEAILLHQNVKSREAKQIAIEMIAKVGIPEPEQRYKEYPHQMSGGMRQRIMIAMALSCQPKLLIADEPTTALDVTIQAQIMDLIKQLQQKEKLGILFITHDLSLVANSADKVAVMYASHIVETSDVKTLFDSPAHPYTQGLFQSIPKLGQNSEKLQTIPGNVPNPSQFPKGCKFHPRCPLTRNMAENQPDNNTITIDTDEGPVRVVRQCVAEIPILREITPGHWCACTLDERYPSGRATVPV